MSSTTTDTLDQEQQIIEAVGNTISHISKNPADGEATFTVRSTLKKAFKAEVKARDHTLIIDEPEDLGGANTGPNPVEYVLAALAGCQELLIKAHAGQLGIEVDSIDVKVQGDIDLNGFFAVSDARPGFDNITYKTTIKTSEKDEKKLRQLEKISLNNCPVLDTIKNKTPVEGTVEFVN